jgi:hypothetical protein
MQKTGGEIVVHADLAAPWAADQRVGLQTVRIVRIPGRILDASPHGRGPARPHPSAA